MTGQPRFDPIRQRAAGRTALYSNGYDPYTFQKKSKSGIATPQPDVELIEKRLKAVLARYGSGGSS
jgi:hypothetical protein